MSTFTAGLYLSRLPMELRYLRPFLLPCRRGPLEAAIADIVKVLRYAIKCARTRLPYLHLPGTFPITVSNAVALPTALGADRDAAVDVGN